MIVYNSLSGLTKVYFGDLKISKVYSGDYLVFPADSPGPSYNYRWHYTNRQFEEFQNNCGEKPDTGNDYILSKYEGITNPYSVIVGDCVTELDTQALSNNDYLRSVQTTNLTTLGDTSIGYNISLTSVTLNEGITTFGRNVFRECSSLESIRIPSTLSTIGYYCFQDCSSLTTVNGLENTTITSIPFYTFYQCTNLRNVSLPSTITSIGTNSFYKCSSLPSIVIPDSVTSISQGAFSQCSALTSVTLSNNLRTIDNSSFEHCYSLQSIEFPNNLRTIGNSAFEYCSGLTSVTINANIYEIKDSAFKSCKGLTSVTCYATTPPTLGTNVFDYTNDCDIFVPCESVDAYKAATNWSTYAARIKPIEGSCSDIHGGGKILYRTGNDGYVTTYNAYNSGMVGLTDDNGNTINSGTYYYGTNKELHGSFSISGDSVNCFGSTSLMGITVPDGITTIGREAFANLLVGANGNLVEKMCIILPDSLTTINKKAFYAANVITINKDVDLLPLIIPTGVTSIAEDALNLDGNGFNYYYSSYLPFYIYFKSSTPPSFTGTIFGGISTTTSTGWENLVRNCVIYVPNGCADAYFTELLKVYNFNNLPVAQRPTASDIFKEDTNGNNLTALENQINSYKNYHNL